MNAASNRRVNMLCILRGVRLRNQYGRADGAATLKIALRLCGLRQRIALADMYADDLAPDQREQRSRTDAARLEGSQVVAGARAREVERSALGQLQRRERRRRPRGIAEAHQHAARPQAVERCKQRVLADTIINDVDALAAVELTHPGG